MTATSKTTLEWILKTGYWEDAGAWDDTDHWKDGPDAVELEPPPGPLMFGRKIIHIANRW